MCKWLDPVRNWLWRVARPDYAATVLADRPVAYWRLGDLATNVAADASGNGHHGLYAGTLQLGAPGIPGAGGDLAARFEGEDGCMLPPHSLPDLRNDFTVEAWFRNAAVGMPFPQLMGDRRRSVRFHFGRWSDNAWTLTKTGLVSFTLGQVPTDAKWHHVALVFSRTGGTSLYVDGIGVGSNPHQEDLMGEHPFPSVGVTVVGTHYGLLDEVSIYDRVLPSERIAAHFRAGAVG